MRGTSTEAHCTTVLPREAHPGTRVGAAGVTQGFNTGVTLYNLASMRQSAEWAEETQVQRMAELADRYVFRGSVGDQDWLTMLGWERPHLFTVLGCEYNKQMYTGRCYKEEEASLCDAYIHGSCDSSKPAKIMH